MARRRLKKRYGYAKRSEGVRVKREQGRIYFVAGNGEVMSTERKRH